MILWLHTFALVALTVAFMAAVVRIKHIEYRTDQLQDWVSRDISRIERLERVSKPVHEDEWMPPIMKHREIKS